MTLIEEINGVKVIQQESAMGPHPRWPDRLVEFNGVTHVLLEDESEWFVCNDCNASWSTIKQAASHRTAHSETKNEPIYPRETIKAVLRAVMRSRDAGDRNYCETAAVELNHRGVKTMNGEKWTAHHVSRVYRFWNGRIKVQLRPGRPPRDTTSATIKQPTQRTRDNVPSPVASSSALVDPDTVDIVANDQTLNNLLADLNRFGEELHGMTTKYESIMLNLSFHLSNLSTTVFIDPDVLDKAKRWDQMRKNFLGE